MIGAIILAAGRATRMGQPKQLLPFGDSTILGTVIDKVRHSEVDVVILVLGHEAEVIVRTLQDLPLFPGLPMLIVINPDYALGLSTSIRAGLEAFLSIWGQETSPALSRTGSKISDGEKQTDKSGVLLVLGDQPWLNPEVINRMMQEFWEPGDIIAPFFQGKRGNPVLWGEEYFPQLLSLMGDRGAKEILKEQESKIRRVEVQAEWIFHDIDTPLDYQKAVARLC